MTNETSARVTDHLANERTFLAWFRTGLTLIAFGIAAAQLLDPHLGVDVPVVRLLSTVVIFTGAFVVGVGTNRYRTNRARIDEDAFRPAGASVVVATGAALLTATLAIAFVWLNRGS